jgi:uncharacterized glyoxalase superfamily protein PhnB
MPQNPPEGMPRISPYLFYTDVPAALDWLAKVFGFELRLSMPGADGSIMHAEMILGDGVIMMGPASEEQDTRSPRELPGVNQSLYVYVDDVNAHFQRAKASGAAIVTEPVEMFWGDRMYSARDLEGHHWSFAQHVKEVAPEDLNPPAA